MEQKQKNKPAFVYMLCCADSTLYTGWSYDVSSRLAVHLEGRGAKYTRARLPVRLVYQEKLPGKAEALRREIAIKKMSRKDKLLLIRSAPNPCGDTDSHGQHTSPE